MTTEKTKTKNTEIENEIKYTETNTHIDKICYLFVVFLTGCFAGWIYEEIYYLIFEGALQNRGVLYGPWLPIYGFGALGIYAFKPLKKHPILLFLSCAFITGVVEYITGFVCIRYYDLRLWDYRGAFLNIDGIICLRSVVSFAIMGLVFHYLLESVEKRMIDNLPPKMLRIICLTLFIILMVDCALSAAFRTPITY